LTIAPVESSAYEKFMAATPDGERLKRCLQCGSCSGICPFGYAMEYPPHKIVAMLRAGRFAPVLNSETVWLCMACYACTSVCPAQIPVTMGLLANLKMELLLAGKVPAELQKALENSQRYGNTLGESPRKRAAWVKDSAVPVPLMAQVKGPVDVLWFVGDYPSYHPRVQAVSRAMAKLFQALGVSFGILGPEEVADGDIQCLAGERGLFEMLAQKNGKAFAKYQFKVVVTTDAHAYNTFKNEYPGQGFSFPVRHHTQFLAEHLEQLKPLLRRELPVRVTFHDPCCIGRVNTNNIFEEPRALLQAIRGVELLEMAHNRANTLCCGAGGGGNWLDGFVWERARSRTSEWRVREAAAIGADILAVACPYETPRFEDAVKTAKGAEALKVKDIAELLAEAIGD
jgi:Fe-S oxidoreductase